MLSSLAAGGIVAAAVALWSQIRQFFSYISSFVVVTAHVDPPIGYAMLHLLHTAFRPVPTGLLHYATIRFTPRRRSRPLLVPFRIPGPSAMFLRGRVLVHASGNSSMTLRGLRGCVDFDALVSEALDGWEAYVTGTGRLAELSNFRIEHLMGREKGMAAFGAHTSNGGVLQHQDEHRGVDVSPHAPGDLHARAELYHRSFKYRREDYVEDATSDPFATLYFDDAVYRHVEQAKRWFAMRQWYAERSIPWRRGWLLHGPGGTGKSSLARAMAQVMGIPLVHFHLGTLSDQEFLDHWNRSLRTPCIVLFEDIDAVFHGRENQTEHKSLSFDTILNALSGVDSQNGVFLVVTTNHPELVDPALGTASDRSRPTRPGRIDAAIEVGGMSLANRRRMASHILRDWPDAVEEAMRFEMANRLVSPVQFQEECLQIAFRKLSSLGEVQAAA